MRRGRLKTLRRHLMKVNPDTFAMNTWADQIRYGRPACGTSACALGHATAIPEFHKLGLRLRTSMGAPYVALDKPKHRHEDHVEHSLDTAVKFFGINYGQASYIFAYDLNNQGQEALDNAIERIDEVLNGEYEGY